MEKGTKLGSEIDGQTILVPSIFHLTLQVGDERTLERVYPSRSLTRDNAVKFYEPQAITAET